MSLIRVPSQILYKLLPHLIALLSITFLHFIASPYMLPYNHIFFTLVHDRILDSLAFPYCSMLIILLSVTPAHDFSTSNVS